MWSHHFPYNKISAYVRGPLQDFWHTERRASTTDIPKANIGAHCCSALTSDGLAGAVSTIRHLKSSSGERELPGVRAPSQTRPTVADFCDGGGSRDGRMSGPRWDRYRCCERLQNYNSRSRLQKASATETIAGQVSLLRQSAKCRSSPQSRSHHQHRCRDSAPCFRSWSVRAGVELPADSQFVCRLVRP